MSRHFPIVQLLQYLVALYVVMPVIWGSIRVHSGCQGKRQTDGDSGQMFKKAEQYRGQDCQRESCEKYRLQRQQAAVLHGFQRQFRAGSLSTYHISHTISLIHPPYHCQTDPECCHRPGLLSWRRQDFAGAGRRGCWEFRR